MRPGLVPVRAAERKSWEMREDKGILFFCG